MRLLEGGLPGPPEASPPHHPSVLAQGRGGQKVPPGAWLASRTQSSWAGVLVCGCPVVGCFSVPLQKHPFPPGICPPFFSSTIGLCVQRADPEGASQSVTMGRGAKLQETQVGEECQLGTQVGSPWPAFPPSSHPRAGGGWGCAGPSLEAHVPRCSISRCKTILPLLLPRLPTVPSSCPRAGLKSWKTAVSVPSQRAPRRPPLSSGLLLASGRGHRWRRTTTIHALPHAWSKSALLPAPPPPSHGTPFPGFCPCEAYQL